MYHQMFDVIFNLKKTIDFDCHFSNKAFNIVDVVYDNMLYVIINFLVQSRFYEKRSAL